MWMYDSLSRKRNNHILVLGIESKSKKKTKKPYRRKTTTTATTIKTKDWSCLIRSPESYRPL